MTPRHLRLLVPSLFVLAGLLVAGSAFAGKVHYKVTIDQSQETPPTGSTATGSAYITVDTDANTLSYYITFSGLSSAETAAHIHGPAARGFTASPKHTLPAGSPKTGTWNYLQADEADILAGLMYINIHSTNFGNGEIRGQIDTLLPGSSTWVLLAIGFVLAAAATATLRRVTWA